MNADFRGAELNDIFGVEGLVFAGNSRVLLRDLSLDFPRDAD